MTTPYAPTPADQQSGSPDQQSDSPTPPPPSVVRTTRTLLAIAAAAGLVAFVGIYLPWRFDPDFYRPLDAFYDNWVGIPLLSLVIVTGLLALITATLARRRVPLTLSVTLTFFAFALLCYSWAGAADIRDRVDHDLDSSLGYGQWVVLAGAIIIFGTVVRALPNLIKYRRPKATPPAPAEPLYQVLYNAEGEKVLVPAGPATGNKSFVATVLLCFFLGNFGAHRFYTGKIGTGILQLLTLGGLGIWAFIDFIMILVGAFKDKKGQALAR